MHGSFAFVLNVIFWNIQQTISAFLRGDVIILNIYAIESKNHIFKAKNLIDASKIILLVWKGYLSLRIIYCCICWSYYLHYCCNKPRILLECIQLVYYLSPRLDLIRKFDTMVLICGSITQYAPKTTV